MADIYDMNVAIAKPNYLATLQQGVQFGNQQRQLKEQRADQNTLRQLAPQIIAGDQAAYGQAAAISPDAANAYQGAGDQQLNRLKGYIDYVEKARASGNPQAVNAAVAAGSGFIGQLTGKPGPTAWSDDPAFLQGWEGLKAKVSMLPQTQGDEPAGYRQAHLTALAAGYQPGTPEYQNAMRVSAGTAPRAIPAGYTTRTYRNAEGQDVTELVQIRGAGTEQAQPIAVGGAAPAADGMAAPTGPVMSGEQIVAQIEAEQGSPLDPQTRARIIADVQRNGGRFDTGSMVPPQGGPQTDAQRAAAAAEQAAQVERRKLEVQQAAAPRQAELDAAREGAVTEARESAELRAANQARAPQVIAKSQGTISLINEALQHPGLSEAVGFAGVYDPRNYIPGTDATDFQVLADQLGGQAFLEAFQSLKGGGAITQIEGQRATDAIARLNRRQSEASYRKALEDLREIAQAAVDRANRGQLAPAETQAPANDGWVIEEVVE